MCVPFPFLFYKFGPAIRRKCKYAREAQDEMERLRTKEEEPEKDVPEDPKVRAEEEERVRGTEEGEEERWEKDLENCRT